MNILKLFLSIFQAIWLISFIVMFVSGYKEDRYKIVKFVKGQRKDFLVKWGLTISTPIALPVTIITAIINHNS